MKHILTLLAVAIFISSAGAHPGKTDKNGGHIDSKTGKYHTHKKEDVKKEPAKKGEVKKKK